MPNSKVYQCDSLRVSLAKGGCETVLSQKCCANLNIQDAYYDNVDLYVMPYLAYDAILGVPFFKRHSKVIFSHNSNFFFFHQ